MLTLVRGFNGRFMIMEQLTGPAGQTYLLRTPRPGEMRLWAMQAVAQGADGLLHFRWRSAERGAEEYWYGVLDHDNVPRARFEEFKQEGQELQKIGPQIVGSKVISQIAVIKDFEDEWVFDYQFLTKEVNVGAVYDALFQAASEQRYNIDFVSPTADLSGYKLVFAPQLALMDDKLAERLQRVCQTRWHPHHVRPQRDQGPGQCFHRGFHSHRLDEFIRCRTGLVSNVSTAVRHQQRPSVSTTAARCRSTSSPKCCIPRRRVSSAGGNAIISRSSPAATEQPFGAGKAVYYGSLFNLDAARCLIKRYAGETGLKPLLADVPEQVEVTCRTKGETDFYFLLNHGDSPVTVNVGRRLY